MGFTIIGQIGHGDVYVNYDYAKEFLVREEDGHLCRYIFPADIATLWIGTIILMWWATHLKLTFPRSLSNSKVSRSCQEDDSSPNTPRSSPNSVRKSRQPTETELSNVSHC